MSKKKKAVPVDEGWKKLKSFVGVKFNDEEKQELWPKVKHLFASGYRPNISSYLKRAAQSWGGR